MVKIHISYYGTHGHGCGSGGKSGPDYPGPRLGRGPFEIPSIFLKKFFKT